MVWCGMGYGSVVGCGVEGARMVDCVSQGMPFPPVGKFMVVAYVLPVLAGQAATVRRISTWMTAPATKNATGTSSEKIVMNALQTRRE